MKTDVKMTKPARPRNAGTFDLSNMLLTPGIYKVVNVGAARVISFGDGQTALYVNGPAVAGLNKNLWAFDLFALVDEDISITFANEG